MAEVTNILLTEKLGYDTMLVTGLVNNTVQGMNYVAGCQDPNSLTNCTSINTDDPRIHFTVETRLSGISRASTLTEDMRPPLLNVLDYKTTDTLFLWQDLVDEAFHSHIALDYYKFYNASEFKPHLYFDPWQRMLELLPSNVIGRCSELGPGTPEDRQTANYIELTHDTGIGCLNDTIWFSPACRANNSECIPLLLQHSYASVMQLAFWLNMPVAIVQVLDGQPDFDAAYYAAVQRGRFLFEWSPPDDSLADAQGRLPVLLTLPPANELEQMQSIFRTGSLSVPARNYGWRRLADVGALVQSLVSMVHVPALRLPLPVAFLPPFLFSRLTRFCPAPRRTGQVDFYDADIDALMLDSRRRKAAGQDPRGIPRAVACAWLRSNEARWRSWLPVSCPSGSYADESMLHCLPCPQDSFCPGGYYSPSACPVGSFCPTAASAPVQCPEGQQASAQGCGACGQGYVQFGGGCARVASAVLVVVLPAALALAAAAACYLRGRIREEEALWQIREDEISFPDPPHVLGYGSQARRRHRGARFVRPRPRGARRRAGTLACAPRATPFVATRGLCDTHFDLCFPNQQIH